jgi:hypothetical protein
VPLHDLIEEVGVPGEILGLFADDLDSVNLRIRGGRRLGAVRFPVAITRAPPRCRVVNNTPVLGSRWIEAPIVSPSKGRVRANSSAVACKSRQLPATQSIRVPRPGLEAGSILPQPAAIRRAMSPANAIKPQPEKHPLTRRSMLIDVRL